MCYLMKVSYFLHGVKMTSMVLVDSTSDEYIIGKLNQWHNCGPDDTEITIIEKEKYRLHDQRLLLTMEDE